MSSTWSDLAEFRRAAINGIRSAGHEPYAWEFMSAQAKRVEDVLSHAIATADVFLLLIGHRYGSVIGGGQVSGVEFELNAAVTLGKPTLVYLIETGEQPSEAVDAFRARIADYTTVRLVTSPRELRDVVMGDLRALERGQPIEGETATIVLPAIERIDLQTLFAHPDELQRCPPRFFEELVADLLRADGWEIDLVARNNAVGPDIIAVLSKSSGILRPKLIVECKRHSDHHPVDVNVVRKVMYWVNEEYRATFGMIATSSRFTSAAVEHTRQHHEWRLALRDQQAILEWLQRIKSEARKNSSMSSG